MRRSPRCTLVAGLSASVLLLALLPLAPAVAQEMIVAGTGPHDRVRLSGFFWYGEVDGTIRAPILDELPGVADELGVRDDLGVEGGDAGWLVGAEFTAAPRHRFLFAFAGLSQQGVAEPGTLPDPFVAGTEASLRDVRGAYKFLFVRSDWIDAGVIGGIGYVDSRVDVTLDRVVEDDDGGASAVMPSVGIAEDFESAYPIIGGSVYFDADNVLAIYTEITGYPSIEVSGQSGWTMNIAIDFRVFPTAHLGVVAGYKRYRLSLEDGDGVGIDLVWDGFTVGAEYQF